jgi:hypothetical protein
VGVYYFVKTLLSRNPGHGMAMARKRAEAPHKKKKQKKKKNLYEGNRNCAAFISEPFSFVGRVCEVGMDYLILSQIYNIARGCVS